MKERFTRLYGGADKLKKKKLYIFY